MKLNEQKAQELSEQLQELNIRRGEHRMLHIEIKPKYSSNEEMSLRVWQLEDFEEGKEQRKAQLMGSFTMRTITSLAQAYDLYLYVGATVEIKEGEYTPRTYPYVEIN